MSNTFHCNSKNGTLEVTWIISKFHLGKFQKSPVFNFRGRILWLSVSTSISKYFDLDKFNIYLSERKKNHRILQAFEVKGFIRKLSYNECFCEKDLDMPLPESRELLGSVYRMKIMNAYNGFATICREWDTIKLEIKFSKAKKPKKYMEMRADIGRKLGNRLNDAKQEMITVKELPKPEDEPGKSEDKMSDFAQERNSSDEEADKLEEIQNIAKETRELIAEMRRYSEMEVSIENQELSEKDFGKMHNYEENTSPFLKLYSLLHDIVDIVLNLKSRNFSISEKFLMTTHCMKYANTFTRFEESSETGGIDCLILTYFQDFICRKRISDISESDIPLLYEFALKYNLPKIMKLCTSYKTENLMSHENVGKLLELALRHNDEELKDDMISDDCTDGKFLQSEHWLKIAKDNPKFACMAYRNFVKSYSAMFNV